MRQEITTIIFSKNRPCQLELLLRSSNLDNIFVLYTYDEYYKKGYEKVISLYPAVNFILEKNFKKDLIGLLKGDYILFFCDDDVFIRDFTFDCPEFKQFFSDDRIITISLRLSRDYDYDFLRNKKVKIPIFDNGKWEWRKYKNDWRYPGSVTSHIFRKEDIYDVILKNDFDNPNTLERMLRRNIAKKPFMLGFEKAKTINIPSNRVQNVFLHRIGNVSTKELNDKFMSGLIISLPNIIEEGRKSKSCFNLIPYQWDIMHNEEKTNY